MATFQDLANFMQIANQSSQQYTDQKQAQKNRDHEMEMLRKQIKAQKKANKKSGWDKFMDVASLGVGLIGGGGVGSLLQPFAQGVADRLFTNTDNMNNVAPSGGQKQKAQTGKTEAARSGKTSAADLSVSWGDSSVDGDGGFTPVSSDIDVGGLPDTSGLDFLMSPQSTERVGSSAPGQVGGGKNAVTAFEKFLKNDLMA